MINISMTQIIKEQERNECGKCIQFRSKGDKYICKNTKKEVKLKQIPNEWKWGCMFKPFGVNGG